MLVTAPALNYISSTQVAIWSPTRTGGLLRRRINSDSSVQPERLETYSLTFEEFLQAHGIERKTGDEAAAEDFDRAIWEYHLWGRIPLRLVRKEMDPILVAKVSGQWYSLYEWE